MSACKRCLNDATVKGIKFDNNGVCNYCNSFQEIENKVNDYNTLSKLFEDRIEMIRGKYDYDVALGISGGKDSMFVLYELVNKYKLKVKTFTMNNGFLSDEAKANIDKMVKEFGVEHEYIEFDKGLLKRFYNYSMKKWLVPCVACSYIGYATMINYTSKINAGLCIHGRSPEQMLRYYGHDVFTELVNAGLKDANEVDVPRLYTKLLSNIESKLDEGIKEDVKKMLFKDIKNEDDFREFVAYFLYHKYDEKYIVDFLRETTSWRPKEDYNHYDCTIHNATNYIYQCAEGRPHALPEVSALIRKGDISREEGEERINAKTRQKMPKDELKKLCDFAGVKKGEILIKAKAYSLFIK